MVFDLHIYVVKLKSNLTFGMKSKKRGYPHIQFCCEKDFCLSIKSMKEYKQQGNC